MITLNIDDIQHNLSDFIKLIQEGNSLIITQADKPIAEIKPIRTKLPEKNAVLLVYVKVNLLYMIILTIPSLKKLSTYLPIHEHTIRYSCFSVVYY